MRQCIGKEKNHRWTEQNVDCKNRCAQKQSTDFRWNWDGNLIEKTILFLMNYPGMVGSLYIEKHHHQQNKSMKFYVSSHFIQNLSQYFHRFASKMLKYCSSKENKEKIYVSLEIEFGDWVWRLIFIFNTKTWINKSFNVVLLQLQQLQIK